jgi:predicted neuraminidase
MKSLFRFLCKNIFILLFFYNGQAQTSPEGIVKSEFIFPTNEFPECHASSIVQTKDGFLVTWFAGTHEKNPDVSIYASRYSHGTWSKPIELANGIQSSDVRYPCWNPVLFQVPQGDLLLFYKVGPTLYIGGE